MTASLAHNADAAYPVFVTADQLPKTSIAVHGNVLDFESEAQYVTPGKPIEAKVSAASEARAAAAIKFENLKEMWKKLAQIASNPRPQSALAKGPAAMLGMRGASRRFRGRHVHAEAKPATTHMYTMKRAMSPEARTTLRSISRPTTRPAARDYSLLRQISNRVIAEFPGMLIDIGKDVIKGAPLGPQGIIASVATGIVARQAFTMIAEKLSQPRSKNFASLKLNSVKDMLRAVPEKLYIPTRPDDEQEAGFAFFPTLKAA